jgi:DNA-binding response OmpR family regulator
MSPRRVLVVDDEPMLALDVACEVANAGYEVVGPVGSVDAALALIEQIGCDIAILDVNLGRETAEPIALVLRDRNIPFIVVSGYARSQQPAAFAAAPFLPKPISTAELLAALAEV